jgi:hypothetical protein
MLHIKRAACYGKKLNIFLLGYFPSVVKKF